MKLEKITRRYELLMNDLDKKMFNMLEEQGKNSVIQRSRLILNDLNNEILKTINSDKSLSDDYVKKYKEISKQLEGKIDLQKIELESNEDINNMKKQFSEKVIDSSNLASMNNQQKIEFYDSVVQSNQIKSFISLSNKPLHSSLVHFLKTLKKVSL